MKFKEIILVFFTLNRLSNVLRQPSVVNTLVGENLLKKNPFEYILLPPMKMSWNNVSRRDAGTMAIMIEVALIDTQNFK